MAQALQGIFVEPAVAIARLGASSTPQDSFSWGPEANPRAGADTALRPEWTLDIQPDGSVVPRIPDRLTFRDGDLIRPVCPYFEIWAWLGEPQSDRSTWSAVPLTPSLLQAHGLKTSDVLVRFEAINAKASRRRNNPALRFGTFPPLDLRANQLTPAPILGVSPPGTLNPMVPAGRNIPLGSLRFIRSTPQPASGTVKWSDEVNVEILRFRYTPPPGRFYGPPSSADTRPAGGGGMAAAVAAAQAFLDPAAGWFNQPTVALDAPADTYDSVSDANPTGPSLGVVDDTSDARIEVQLALSPRVMLTARATLFVGPPDFAPDRRPFLSLADEINDRAADIQARTALLTKGEKDEWIEDLFERVFETVSLMNVDNWRRQHAKTLASSEQKAAIGGDGLNDSRAMGARDKLRNQIYSIGPGVQGIDPLPLFLHAKSRHRALADLIELERFIRTNPGRIQRLIRTVFEVGEGEGPSQTAQEQTTMKMPPFMRNSNAQPLTLSGWQYDLLMDWVESIEVSPAPAVLNSAMMATATTPAPAMSEPAARRMEQVLSSVQSSGNP